MANTLKFDKQTLGMKIRLARIAAGLTQQELAARISAGLTQRELVAGVYITQSSISDFENDKTEPRFTLMLRIIRVLAVDISSFIPPDLK